MERCVHFNGLIAGTCKAGVAYASVKDDSQSPYRYPCFVGEHAAAGACTSCATASFPTEEQARAEQAEFEAHLNKRSADIAAGICPTHGTPMTKRQVGRCVYADPCGCRLYQGRL